MKKNKIHFLNTIWSDAIILQIDNHYAFIDSGSDFYYPMIKKHLNDLNINKIDFILLTHFHSDHYGCIANLIGDFKVDNLYLKRYFGLEGSTSGGIESDDSYINEQIKNYNFILNKAKSNNTIVSFLEKQSNDNFVINFCGHDIELYNINNDLYDIYNDKNNKYYKQRAFSENFNSIGIFFMVNNFSVFLASDLTCQNHEIDVLNNKAIKLINDIYKRHGINHIDIYKSCHHGHSHNNPYELLRLINPNYTIITNTNKWVDNFSICKDLKQINPNCKILLTDYQKYIFKIEKQIEYQKIDDISLFIILEKE